MRLFRKHLLLLSYIIKVSDKFMTGKDRVLEISMIRPGKSYHV